MQSNVIIACDFSQEEQLINFLNKFKNEKLFLKIGYELFFKFGEEIVWKIKKLGHKLFLDLKLLDIPNTVEHGVSNLMKFEPNLLSIHASGGIEMMKAALRGVGKYKTKLVAVTQLTSLSSTVLKNELLIDKDISSVVLQYARNAYTAGITGVVCSVWESKQIRKTISQKIFTVTPGIRLLKTTDDQQRVATPKEAKVNLVNYIVVGRPITQAKDPYKTYKEIVKNFQGA